MSMELVIPTFKRLDSQITLSNIPDSLLDSVTLVVQPQEEVEARKIHHNIFVVSGDNIGFAKTIRDLTYEFAVNRQSRFWILDDDLKFLRHYKKDDGSWSFLCTVAQGNLSKMSITTPIGDIELESTELTIMGKIGFLLAPDITDMVFFHQLSDKMREVLKAEVEFDSMSVGGT